MSSNQQPNQFNKPIQDPNQPGYPQGQVYPPQPGQPQGQIYAPQVGQPQGQVYPPQPGYPQGQVYPQQPGIPQGQVYPPQTGQLQGQVYPPQPGYPQGQVYPPQPGYPQGQIYPPQTVQPQGQVYPPQPGYPQGQVYPPQPGYPQGQVYPPQTGQPQGQVYPPQTSQPQGQVYPPQPGQPQGQIYPTQTGPTIQKQQVSTQNSSTTTMAQKKPPFDLPYYGTIGYFYDPSIQNSATIPGTKYNVKFDPSLKPDLTATPEADVTKLIKAFKGRGYDADTVIKILSHRTTSQMEKIQETYKSVASEDLIVRIKNELQDSFELVVVLAVLEGAKKDAHILYTAMKGMGTDEDALRQVVCTKTCDQFFQIKNAFHQMYNKTLQSFIEGDTSGNFRALLLMIINNQRDPETSFDEILAKRDIQHFYDPKSPNGYISGNIFELFTKRSYCQLRGTFDQFSKDKGQPFLSYLESHKSDDCSKTLIDMYSFISNTTNHFANKLKYLAQIWDMSGIAYIIATRCEIDLQHILNEFKKLHGVEFIESLDNKWVATHLNTVMTLKGLIGKE